MHSASCRIPAPLRLGLQSSVCVSARFLFSLRPHDRKSHFRATSSACGFDKCCYPGPPQRILVKTIGKTLGRHSMSCTADFKFWSRRSSLLPTLVSQLCQPDLRGDDGKSIPECEDCRHPNNYVNTRILHLGQNGPCTGDSFTAPSL